MKNETQGYVNGLKRAAFRHGLSFPMLSIHQDFVDPDEARRRAAIDHTIHCIKLAHRLGISCIRLNSGRWGTIESFDDLMSEHGDEAGEADGQSEAPLADATLSGVDDEDVAMHAALACGNVVVQHRVDGPERAVLRDRLKETVRRNQVRLLDILQSDR